MLTKPNVVFKTVMMFVLVLTIVASSEVSAQSTEDLMEMSLDDILNMEVTTASKNAQSIRDVPAAMVVITKDEIRTYGYSSVVEILQNVPGFYSLGSASLSGGATNFGVRGFSTSGSFSTVMVMVNGVNQMEDIGNSYDVNALNIPLNAINRIEIVRGPMAVIYGSNAFLGAINIITDSFDESEKSEIYTSGGSLSSYSSGGYISRANEDFKFKAYLDYSKSDGLNIKYSDVIADNMFLTTSVGGIDNTMGQLGSEGYYSSFCGQYDDFSVDMTKRRYVNGSFSFLPAVNETGFNTAKDQSFFKFGYNPDLTENIQLGLKFSTSMYESSTEDVKVFTPTNQISVRSKSINHNFEAMVNISKSNLNFGGGIGYRLVPVAQNTTDIPLYSIDRATYWATEKYATKSAYAQASYQASNWLNLTAGLRAEHTDDYNVKGEATITGSYGQDSTYSYSYGKVKQGGLVFIPRIAAIIKANDKNVIKLMYGNSKKRASLNKSITVSSTSVYDLGLADMHTVELNYLTTISDLRSAANISVFYSKMKGLPVTVLRMSGPNTGLFTTNDGKYSTIGAEASITFSPSEKLKTEVALCYQSNTDDTPGYESIDVALVPEILGYLKAYYRVNEIVSLGFKGRYISKMLAGYDIVSSARLGPDTPDYFLVDVNLLTSNLIRGFGFDIYASNILDTEVRYPTNSNADWVDKGMLGYGRRLNTSVFYRF